MPGGTRDGEGEEAPAIDLSARNVVLALAAIAGISAALRITLARQVPGPFVFLDELGYQRLAQHIGQTGRLGLFDKTGLSYSPLYPALLSPIYALGASATTAYEWMRYANAILMSIAVVPIYKIGRFVLPRRDSILVAGLSMIAPLMYYTVFVMSENLAFPLCLVAVWAMIAAVEDARARTDAILLLSILAATAARIQLVVLLPAALTAVVLAAAARRKPAPGGRSFAGELRRHWLLFAGAGLLVVLAGARALTSGGWQSIAGRYGNVGQAGLPDPWQVAKIAVQHVAGLDLAVGVVPFVGAFVACVAFFRFGRPRKVLPFAAVATSVTAWLVLEIAVDAAHFDTDFRRIHERYMFYVVPLFLVALLGIARVPQSKISVRLYLAAAAVAALLPAAIPFHSLINISSVADSFGLLGFGHFVDGGYAAIPHATILAVWIAAVFGLTYVVVRQRMRSVVILVAIAFLLLTSIVTKRVQTVAVSARTYLPAHRDWVDRTKPTGDVILITGTGMALPWHLTAFNNESIARVYSLCKKRFGGEFGEEVVTIDSAGHVRSPSGVVEAPYAVVPPGLRVQGRVVARNPNGNQVLVAPRDGRVMVPTGNRSASRCA